MMAARSTTVQPTALNQISFDGDHISVVEKDGQYYVALKPISDVMGLDWGSQYRNLQEDVVMSSTVVTTTTVGNDGKQREMVCLPLEYLNGWLFKINPTRYQGDRQDKIIRYQKECYRVLYNHFFPSGKQSDQVEDKTAQLKKIVTNRRLELSLIKANLAMEKQAEEMAERIFKGNGNINELDLCPELQALTRAVLEKLNQGDLFNQS